MKKALSLILMLVMVFSALVPSMVLAADEIDALSHVNVAAGKSYTTTAIYTTDGVQSWPDEGGVTLTDGAKASADAGFSDPVWVGFNKQSADYDSSENGYGATTVIDLGASTELSKVAFQAFGGDAGISVPYWINLYVSDDGETYTFAKYLEINTDNAVAGVNAYELDIDVTARFVKVCFYGYGWIFIDEIEIYGEGADVPVEPEVQKTYENTLVKGDNGNYSCEVPYGYTWEVDYINGKIGGEDVTICTTQDAYNACNPNWAITIYAELQEDGTYVALKNAIVTPGSAAGAGISIGEGQIAIVVHSSASNPDAGDYPNWLGKVVAMSVKAGDVLVVDMDGMTVYAPIPGEEIVLPEPPAAELPEGAIALDYAGYVHDSYFEILAGDNMTVAELTALGIGAEKDMNYFVVAVVGADGVITEMHTALGRPDGVKSDVVCPEGGYIIGLNGNKAGYEALLSANVGDSVKLYNVDVDSFRGAEGSIALENAGFVIEAFVPENFKTEIIVGDNACLTDGFKDLTDSWASGVPAGKIVLAANGNCKEVGMDTAIVYALGETKSIDSVALYFYVDAGSMIGYPEGTAVVSVSVDGENYNVVDKFEIAEVDYSAPSTVANVFEFDAVEAAYVKVDVYSGSNEAVRGDAEWDGKVNWEFISLVEVEVSEVEVEPEPELPEGALKIDISHVNAYTWGVYNEMVIYGEGQNSMSAIGYDCTWWLAFKVENIDGVYTVTEIEGNGETKDMVAPADGFLVYCFSNDAASYEAATKLSVGATLYLANFDWTQQAASETPIGQLYFVPFSYGENVALGKPVQNADKRPTYNADLTDGVAIGNLTYNAADWFGFYWNPGMDLEGNLGQSTNAMYGIANPVVDLGGLYDLTTVRLNLFTGNNSGITAPETVTLKVSVDGIHYEEIEVVGFEWPESGSSKVEWVDFTLPEGTVAQYVCLEMVMRTTFALSTKLRFTVPSLTKLPLSNTISFMSMQLLPVATMQAMSNTGTAPFARP
ncbi:MAG: discoidin domain-containing protein, partial [Clostridia bacterium]|nr:discoidin domain-containing protein [Clostridia bacterium]